MILTGAEGKKRQAPSVRLGTTASKPVTGPSTDAPSILSDYTVASSPPQLGADPLAEMARGRRWRTWRRMNMGRGWSWRTVDCWSRIWSRLSFEPRYFEGKRKRFLLTAAAAANYARSATLIIKTPIMTCFLGATHYLMRYERSRFCSLNRLSIVSLTSLWKKYLSNLRHFERYVEH